MLLDASRDVETYEKKVINCQYIRCNGIEEKAKRDASCSEKQNSGLAINAADVYNPTTRPMRWSKKDDFECKVYGHWARDRPWIEWKQNVLKAAKGRGEMHYGGQVKKEAN